MVTSCHQVANCLQSWHPQPFSSWLKDQQPQEITVNSTPMQSLHRTVLVVRVQRIPFSRPSFDQVGQGSLTRKLAKRRLNTRKDVAAHDTFQSAHGRNAVAHTAVGQHAHLYISGQSKPSPMIAIKSQNKLSRLPPTIKCIRHTPQTQQPLAMLSTTVRPHGAACAPEPEPANATADTQQVGQFATVANRPSTCA
jgi:hypothetical protein